jgi:hypothetical protein
MYKGSRKSRGKTQKLFLIECHDGKEYERKYDVMGTTGNVYTVSITNKPTCSCPDHTTRSKRCKHIYFVLIRIMKVGEDEEDIPKYSNIELNAMFKKIPNVTDNLKVTNTYKNKYKNLRDNNKKKGISIKQQKLDDLCPICLDDLDNGENVEFCKFSCGKNVHSYCFNMWCTKKNTKKCVFCNNSWDDKYEDLAYINLIS